MVADGARLGAYEILAPMGDLVKWPSEACESG